MNGRLARRIRRLADKFQQSDKNQAARRPWTGRELYQALKKGYKMVRRGAEIDVINPFEILAIRHGTRKKKRLPLGRQAFRATLERAKKRIRWARKRARRRERMIRL